MLHAVAGRDPKVAVPDGISDGRCRQARRRRDFDYISVSRVPERQGSDQRARVVPFTNRLYWRRMSLFISLTRVLSSSLASISWDSSKITCGVKNMINSLRCLEMDFEPNNHPIQGSRTRSGIPLVLFEICSEISPPTAIVSPSIIVICVCTTC